MVISRFGKDSCSLVGRSWGIRFARPRRCGVPRVGIGPVRESVDQMQETADFKDAENFPHIPYTGGMPVR
jgi:hypothetical protein